MDDMLAMAKNPYVQIGFVIFLLAIAFCIHRITYRYSSIRDLPQDPKGYAFYGIATSVSDGDGFKLFHVPWFRSSSYSRASPKLPVRLAGIDAPESRFFSTPAQPFSKEAKDYLKSLVHTKMVYVDVQSLDIYNRLVAIAYVRTGMFSWTNINLEMVKAGLACVYDRAGAAYGKYKSQFLEAEKIAKRARIGMWSSKNIVLPMDYKSKRK